MGWRRLLHRITGWDMTHSRSFSRDDDLCISFTTLPDGEGLRHACLTRDNELIDEINDSHPAVVARITLWIEEFS